MNRLVFAVSALLLAMSPVAMAQDRHTSLPDLEFRQQQLHSTDRELSPGEYEKLYSRNQRYMRRTLSSYTKQTLNRMGVPDRAINYMGAAFGVVTSGAKLDLNESKTLALEIKNLDSQEPELYFGIDLKW